MASRKDTIDAETASQTYFDDKDKVFTEAIDLLIKLIRILKIVKEPSSDRFANQH